MTQLRKISDDFTVDEEIHECEEAKGLEIVLKNANVVIEQRKDGVAVFVYARKIEEPLSGVFVGNDQLEATDA